MKVPKLFFFSVVFYCALFLGCPMTLDFEGTRDRARESSDSLEDSTSPDTTDDGMTIEECPMGGSCRCDDGTKCLMHCTGCTLECGRGATCDFRCTGGCNITCQESSSCEIQCTGGCTTACLANATCSQSCTSNCCIDCHDESTSCEQTCDIGVCPRECQ